MGLGKNNDENRKTIMRYNKNIDGNYKLILSITLLLTLSIYTMLVGCESESPIQTEDDESITAEFGVLTGTVQPYEALVVLQRNGADFRSTIANDEGRWILSELPIGNYSLYVVASGYFTDISRNDINVEAGETFDIGTVVLRPHTEAATLIGKVIDGSDGQPIPKSEINVICVTGICAPVIGITDSEGNFSIQLWSGLAGKVNIKSQDHQPTIIRVQELPPRQIFDLETIVLERK
ncbi:carboxypeptidase regulatory-like domain-containing protein [Candidatus Poribacteria bacterium]|nr:carboxypeptidase regulatory-like domain-containing protein [Candidatus Poribacteria bacterium]